MAADATVLELGSGPGFFSPHIAKQLTTGHLVLLDLQIEMLTLARQRLGRSTGAVRADGQSLPFPHNTFDVVFIATVLGELPEPKHCIREVGRVLRKGGRLAICETRRDSDFFPLARLRELVEPCGFQLQERRGWPWQYVAHFQPA